MPKEKENLIAEYIAEWKSWHAQYQMGCSDPTWTDGVNLNLTRNHMIYCSNQGVVPPKDMPLPPEVDHDYMAKRDEIIANMKIALERYESNEIVKQVLEIPKLKDKDLEYYRDFLPARIRQLKKVLAQPDNDELPMFRRVLENLNSNIKAVADRLEIIKSAEIKHFVGQASLFDEWDERE